jgi:glutamate dehydrogenase (NAD(P)+)
VYNAKGLDIPALAQHRRRTGSITDFAGGENIDREQALFLETDVLLPAAKENVIRSSNAHRLNCKILTEGANGPTTYLADPAVDAKGIFVVPDILANSGGVSVSYFEWVQDRMGYFWTEKDINTRLAEIMTRSFDAVTSYADRRKVNNRTAAYMLAMERVANTIKVRGIYG